MSRLILSLALVLPLVLAKNCDVCPTSVPEIQLGGAQMTVFSKNLIVGKNVAGCQLRNMTCTSNTAGFMPVISFNADQNGVWESPTKSGTIQLVCQDNKYWTYTQNGATIKIDQLACLGDYKGVL